MLDLERLLPTLITQATNHGTKATFFFTRAEPLYGMRPHIKHVETEVIQPSLIYDILTGQED